PVERAMKGELQKPSAPTAAHQVAATVAEHLLHLAAILQAELARISVQQHRINLAEPGHPQRIGHQAFPPASSLLDRAATTAPARRCASARTTCFPSPVIR